MAKKNEMIVIDQIGSDGAVKSNGQWYKVSKFSAFKDFKMGESYNVETEQYEYQGFLRNRILRVLPKE